MLTTFSQPVTPPYDLFAGDGAVAPTLPSATGVYTSANITYSSAIDLTITNLAAKFCYDNGVAAALPATVPILVIMHGYAGSMTSFNDSDLQRFASYGFFVISVGMRGKNSASGSVDASAREIHDILDALTYVRANYAGVVDPTKAAIVGYSGGGGNVMGCLTKCPDYFTSFISLFGISDYGYRPVTSWYDYGQISLSPTSKSYLDTDIGVRTAASAPYLARMASAAIPKALALGGFLELFHDASDLSVSVESSRQVVSELQASGLTGLKYAYHESSSLDATRWLHGHPQDHLPEMTAAEWIFARRCRDSSVWSVPVKGSIRVNGWFKSRGQDFEIWLGDASSPRSNGTGGRNKVAEVDFDVVNGTFKITPVTTSGTMYVTVRLGTVSESFSIADGLPVLVQFYGDSAYNYKFIFDASTLGFSDNATVAKIPDASGQGNIFVTSNSPVYKSTGIASGPSIRFNGTNQYAVCSSPVLTNQTKYSVAVVTQFSVITGTRAALIFGLNTQGFGLGCNLNSTSKFELENPGSFRDDMAAADTNPHLFIFTWNGSAWTFEIDGVAKTGSFPAVAPQTPITRAVIGAYSNVPNFPFSGDMAYIAAASVAWSASQRAAIRAYVKSIWTGLP